jgi:single-stranded-DNA-specific exonuclease
MAKRWRIRPHDPALIRALEHAAGVPPVVAQLLASRGLIDAAAVREFLEVRLSALHPPELLPGVSEAAARLHAAISAGRKIVVYGDYDVDGMAATALLWRCLKLLGGQVVYHVPHRLDEGYGLSCEALDALAADGAAVVVTVDCGIASTTEADHARRLGLELIVTDHHEPGPRLPEAAAVVHPRLSGGAYPFGELCGSGVAFKLAWALCQQASQAKRVSEAMRGFLVEAVDLVALGTVADMVPLVGENRVFVAHGLQGLRGQASPGLRELLRVCGLTSKAQLATEDIGFSIAPRLNAAGRLGQARLGVELLTTASDDRARELADYLNHLNESRQSLERSVYLAALKQAQEQFDPEGDAALVLADRGWHAGVIGIVAGRLAEKFHRPVVLVSLDECGTRPGLGSARSVPGFHLHQALAACGGHLVTHGGHAAAAGLKVEERSIEAFRAAFVEHAAAEIAADDRVADLWIDAEVPLAWLSLQAVEHLERLAPFGCGNARPVLCATGVSLVESPKPIGGGGRHLSLKLAQQGVRLRAVAFGWGDRSEELSAAVGGPLAVAFRPMINEYQGRRTVELHLADYQPAAVTAPA